MFPNVSFPASGPSDTFLASQGAVKVSLFRDHDTATQKLVPCDPVVEDGFAYIVAVANKTSEELDQDVINKAARMRADRNKRLVDSDWTQLTDAPVNKEEWAQYRQALRDLPDDASWPNIDFPLAPGEEAFVEPAGNSD